MRAYILTWLLELPLFTYFSNELQWCNLGVHIYNKTHLLFKFTIQIILSRFHTCGDRAMQVIKNTIENKYNNWFFYRSYNRL